jgi:phage antirepressor YoqD-like protein
MNNLQIFKNDLFEVAAKLDNGEIAFDVEHVAKCLGFTKTETKNGREYTSVRWARVNEYLRPRVGESIISVAAGDLIPEPLVYKLAFKANNEVAEKFQDWLAIEVIPSIRKTGGYVGNDDIFVSTYLPFADDQTKLLFRATLETVRKQNELIGVMQPKANYFDAIVERNLLTNFRDTAKELQVKERPFIQWLLDNKYVYRDQKDKLKPYAQYVPDLFEIKDFERNGKAGTQTLITPKGKETFRLLMEKKVS